MASEKTATIKLSLNGSSYIGELKHISQESETAATRVESAWKKSAVAGLKEFRQQLGDLGSSVKSTLKTVATLGGTITFGAAIKGAVEAQDQFKNLSFAIKAGTGELVAWNDLQKDTQATSAEWAQSSRELGKVYHDLFSELGDIKLAKVGMENAAMAARATGESVESLANITGTLGEKFNVTATEMPEAMAAVISLGNKGGISIGQMGEKLGLLGASARAAGLQGTAGFQTIVGMANIADNAMGSFKKSLGAVTGLLDTFGTPEQAKKIGNVFGVAVKDAKGNARDLTQVMGEIFQKTGGQREKLALAFTGEQLKLVVELGKTYSDTFKATTGSIKTKTDAALAAYNAAVHKAGQSELTAAQLRDEANNRMKDPQARLAQAIEKIEQSFTKPKMIDAIEKLAELLPELADQASKLIGFVLENPGTSAAVAAGVKLGAPALQAALSAAAPGIGKAVMGALGQGGGAFSVGGGAPGALGKAAGVVGAVGAVAAAGAVGYEVGSALADNVVDPARKKSAEISGGLQGATLAAGINTTGRIDPKRAQESLDTLRQRLDAARKDREFSFSDVYTLGLRRLGTASDEDVKKGQEAYDQGVAALEQKMGPAAEKTASQLTDVNEALGVFAANLRGASPGGVGGAGASRGPIQPAPPAPGYAPR